MLASAFRNQCALCECKNWATVLTDLS